MPLPHHRISRIVFSMLSLSFALLLCMPTAYAWAELAGPAPDDPPVTEEFFADGVVPDYTPAPSIHDENESLVFHAYGAAPSYYNPLSPTDLGIVTPVKSQGSFGTCWAFATLGVLETSLLKQGLAPEGTVPDLSERHLVYFAYHTQPDPLGGTTGDSTEAIEGTFTGQQSADPYLFTGSNYPMTANTLASWMGAASENALPTYAELQEAYRNNGSMLTEDFLSFVALDSTLSHSVNTVHLRDVRRIPMDDTEAIKQAIMDNGAVGFNIRYSSSYLNRQTGGFYNKTTGGSGHTVMVVGWDDSYSTDNFLTAPPYEGAWLAKNSYGTSNGKDGYIWISYADNQLHTTTAKAYEFVASVADELDNIYQYDGTAGTCTNTVDSGGSVANVYTTAANPTGEECLRAVGISLSDSNVNYSVQIYTGLTNPSDPTSGTAILAQPITGKTTFAGFYTIDIDDAPVLAEGTTFSVVVTLSHANGTSIKYDVDTTYGANDRYQDKCKWAHFTSHVDPLQSFERDNASASWEDLSLSTYDTTDEPACCARVKAYTTNETVEPLYNLADAKIAPIAPQRKTGEPLKPAVTLTYGNTVLREGYHYELSYTDNVEVGTATVTATGLGWYQGTIGTTFAIYADPQWERLAGQNALETMAAIVEADGVFTSANVDTVVIASADGYKDALAATGLAGRLHAPVLITPKGKLADQTKAQLQRLQPSQVVVAGGAAAVSDNTYQQIVAALPSARIRRVYGRVAVDTSVELWRAGSGWGDTAIVATSNSYKDALSIAPFAYAKGAPIFLAKPAAQGYDRILSDEVLDAIFQGGFTRIVIVGGTSAVSARVPQQIESLLVGTSQGEELSVVRLGGSNALATSSLIAQFELGEGLTLTNLTIATSSGYKDALCGAALAGAQNSVLVLANPVEGYAAFDSVFVPGSVVTGHVLGGPVAISAESWNYFTTK